MASIPHLTPEQSRRRIAELRRRGCEVRRHTLASGDVVVLKKCPRGSNPNGSAITAEVPWWSGRVVVERAGGHYHAKAMTRGGRTAYAAGGHTVANAIGNLRAEVEQARAANPLVNALRGCLGR